VDRKNSSVLSVKAKTMHVKCIRLH